MSDMQIHGQALVHGAAQGPLLYAPVALSFWAGINPQTGDVIDRHHPLYGRNVRDAIVALPGSRGSCSGSLVVIELLLQGCAPAGLIFHDEEQIVTLGVIVAGTLLDKSIPVLRIPPAAFQSLQTAQYASIQGTDLFTSPSPFTTPLPALQPPSTPRLNHNITLTDHEKALLRGTHGPAPQKAMTILLSFASLLNAPRFTPVTRAHIDACIYTGPASLLIPSTFLSLGARFAIPTTLNSISIDRTRWRDLGVDLSLAIPADTLASTYTQMGARDTFTCAPYLLDDKPQEGESVGWAESNAVVFANSVLGARTGKYPDLVDVCIGITGVAPLVGTQDGEGRKPTIVIRVSLPGLEEEGYEEDFWPVLGYVVGKVAGGKIPLVTGIEEKDRPGMSELKAFGAAFATMASAAMFHILGVTPEAGEYSSLRESGGDGGIERVEIGMQDLNEAKRDLTTATDGSVQLVSLGNPHFALEEFARLAEWCTGRKKAETVRLVVTTNRSVYGQAMKGGYMEVIQAFGGEVLTDTCWCMLGEPVVGGSVRNLMTNSAKYAHYAPGMVKRGVHFGSLAACVDAAVHGHI